MSLRRLRFDGVELHVSRDTVVSVFADGVVNVMSLPWVVHQPDYQETAAWAGYGADAGLYGREHEVAHHLVAELMGWGPSPAIHRNGLGVTPVPLELASAEVRRDEHLANHLQRASRLLAPDSMHELRLELGDRVDEALVRFRIRAHDARLEP